MGARSSVVIRSDAVRASAIVVNWNAGPALVRCLRSLGDAGNRVAETIVVDNASDDGSLEAARQAAPWVRVIETGANLGFARGANRGAATATGDVLVFVNPDAVVAPGAVPILVDALLRDPGAGIAGGGLRNVRGRWQPSSAHFGPLRHLVLDTTVGRLPARWRRAPHRVEWVYGTFMAVRSDVFRRLAGFDPAYFCYGEDLDLCHRAAVLGVRTILVPGARAVHGSGPSATRRFGESRAAAVVEGELRFYARRTAPRTLALYRAVAVAKFGTKAALAAAVGRRRTAVRYLRVVRACLAPVPA